MRTLDSKGFGRPFKTRTVIVWATITSVALISVILILILVPDMIFATELFAGITGVVSLGILIAAVAAAIYTKPAYDDFRRQAAPCDVRIAQFSLKDGDGNPLESKALRKLDDASMQNSLMVAQPSEAPIFIVRPSVDILIKFQVELKNFELDRNVEVRFNLYVPSTWELYTDQQQHGVSRTTIQVALGGSILDVRYTRAIRVFAPAAGGPFYADIRLRSLDVQSVFGTMWPMSFNCSIGTRAQSIWREWWIEIAGVSG